MLGVVATIKVKPGMEQQFEAVAKELVAKVNANEPGCRLYALHRAEAPQTYVFMERYADQAAVDADHVVAQRSQFGEDEFLDRDLPGERLVHFFPPCDVRPAPG